MKITKLINISTKIKKEKKKVLLNKIYEVKEIENVGYYWNNSNIVDFLSKKYF